MHLVFLITAMALSAAPASRAPNDHIPTGIVWLSAKAPTCRLAHPGEAAGIGVGVVTDIKGSPITGVRIRVLGFAFVDGGVVWNDIISGTTSDERGLFYVSLQGPRASLLWFEKDGYTSQRTSVDVQATACFQVVLGSIAGVGAADQDGG